MALLLDEHDSGSGASARRGVRPPGGPDLGVIKDARRRRRSRVGLRRVPELRPVFGVVSEHEQRVELARELA